jgi:hypothetical protein
MKIFCTVLLAFLISSASIAQAEENTPHVGCMQPLSTIEYKGLDVDFKEIRVIGYAIGFRHGYDAVKTYIASNNLADAQSISERCEQSLQRDRSDILARFQGTKPGNVFCENFERGLVAGHEDGNKSGIRYAKEYHSDAVDEGS